MRPRLRTWTVLALAWTVLLLAAVKLSFYLDPLYQQSREAFCLDPTVRAVWPDAMPDGLTTTRKAEYHDRGEGEARITEFWFEARAGSQRVRGRVVWKRIDGKLVAGPSVMDVNVE